MMPNRILTDEQTVLRRYFLDFFNWDSVEDKYTNRINGCLLEKRLRMIVDIEDLLDFYPTAAYREHGRSLGHEVIENPNTAIPLLEMSLTDIAQRRDSTNKELNARARRMRVGLRGAVGSMLSPRELKASSAKRVAAVSGIVTRVSAPRCRVLETVHYCPVTGRFTKRAYRDSLSAIIDNENLPAINVMPRKDQTGNVLRTEFGLSMFQDVQTFTLQEAPESTPPGQLPRSIEVRVEDDLVDSVKSGDRVSVVGVYQPYVKDIMGKKDFDAILVANDITHTQKERNPIVSDDDMETIRSNSSKTNVLDILAEAVAPSVHGRVEEKKGIILMLAGGVERVVKDTHIRGDINLLFVGEPATAKSQLMRFVYQLAPQAIHTTGRGSTGVGLTAAVVQDPDTGDRTLCAGAMVLADRGVLCVDEFDKMSPADRVAMHEAMEQQTITIAKAGIHASINARCSVLAAANPMFGYYSTSHSLSTNLGLPESLLSRFDLTFLILDSRSVAHTRNVSSHVLTNHMTATPCLDEQRSVALVPTTQSAHEVSNPWGKKDLLTIAFLRKYLAVAKAMQPNLTPAAVALVSDLYAELRKGQSTVAEVDKKDALHVSPRTLEGLIRLATAHAKLRLSTSVTVDDVGIAYTLVKGSVFATMAAKEERQAEVQNWASNHKKRGREEERAAAAAAPAPSAPKEVDPTVMTNVMQALQGLQEETGRVEFGLHEVHSHVRHLGYSLDTVLSALKKMTETGSVVYTAKPDGDTFTSLL